MCWGIPNFKHINICNILFPSPGTLFAMRMIHTDNSSASFGFVLDTQKVFVGFACIIIRFIYNILDSPHIAMTAMFCQLCTVNKCQTVNLRKFITVDIMIGNHKKIELVFLCFINNLLKSQSSVRRNCMTMRYAGIPFITVIAHIFSPLNCFVFFVTFCSHYFKVTVHLLFLFTLNIIKQLEND